MANLAAPLEDVDTSAPFLPDDFVPVDVEVGEAVLKDVEDEAEVTNATGIEPVDGTGPREDNAPAEGTISSNGTIPTDGTLSADGTVAAESSEVVSHRTVQFDSLLASQPEVSFELAGGQPQKKAPAGSPAWALKSNLPDNFPAGRLPGVILFMTLEIPKTATVGLTRYGLVAYDPFVTKSMSILDVVERYRGSSLPLPYYEVFTTLTLGADHSPQYKKPTESSKPPAYYAGVFGSASLPKVAIAGHNAAPWYFKNAGDSSIKDGFSLTYWNNGEITTANGKVEENYGVFTGPIHQRFNSQTETKIMPVFIGNAKTPVLHYTSEGGDVLNVYVEYFAMNEGPLKPPARAGQSATLS